MSNQPLSSVDGSSDCLSLSAARQLAGSDGVFLFLNETSEAADPTPAAAWNALPVRLLTAQFRFVPWNRLVGNSSGARGSSVAATCLLGALRLLDPELSDPLFSGPASAPLTPLALVLDARSLYPAQPEGHQGRLDHKQLLQEECGSRHANTVSGDVLLLNLLQVARCEAVRAPLALQGNRGSAPVRGGMEALVYALVDFFPNNLRITQIRYSLPAFCAARLLAALWDAFAAHLAADSDKATPAIIPHACGPAAAKFLELSPDARKQLVRPASLMMPESL
jgi:hypothetical protein